MNRTSYDTMSTWIFNDNKPNKLPESIDLYKEVLILNYIYKLTKKKKIFSNFSLKEIHT